MITIIKCTLLHVSKFVDFILSIYIRHSILNKQAQCCNLEKFGYKIKWKSKIVDNSRCGKLLKSELDAQAHAARTQHDQFSESTEEVKPLTEEEKKIQLEK